jgi:hypothetical protein
MGLLEEKQYVAWAMTQYGGGFVGKLGQALYQADSENARKIHDTWPEYWAKYLEMGIKHDPDASAGKQ